MDKTSVRVEFRILGDNFDPNKITSELGINPNKQWTVGDKGKISNKIMECSCWEICTDYEESLDINNQLKKIIDVVKTKKQKLVEIKKQYSLEYIFGIIIRIENNMSPAVYINIEDIELASEIKAEFDFDIYIY